MGIITGLGMVKQTLEALRLQHSGIGKLTIYKRFMLITLLVK